MPPLSPAPLPRDFGRSSTSGFARGPISKPITVLILFLTLSSHGSPLPTKLGEGELPSRVSGGPSSVMGRSLSSSLLVAMYDLRFRRRSWTNARPRIVATKPSTRIVIPAAARGGRPLLGAGGGGVVDAALGFESANEEAWDVEVEVGEAGIAADSKAENDGVEGEIADTADAGGVKTAGIDTDAGDWAGGGGLSAIGVAGAEIGVFVGELSAVGVIDDGA